MSSKLQGILVQLLREIDDICRKNDIRYYIWGGTCIGQLRHGGFIPWDDDIDLVMPRKDYEKLESIIDDYMPEGRELVSTTRQRSYTNPIPRYMDLNTTAIRSGRLGDGTVAGECIEIFILDPMPRDHDKQGQWKKLLFVYAEILCTGWIQAKRRMRKEFLDIDLYNEYRNKMDRIGRVGVLEELEAKLFNIDEEDSDTYCLRWMPRSLYEIPIRCYGTPQDVIYEGMHVLGPERPREMLQLYIGHSWRNLLPPEARDAHPTRINHELAAGNCEREFYQVRSCEQMAADLQEYKDKSLDYYRIRNAHYVDRAKPSMRYAAAKVRKLALEAGPDRLRQDSVLAVRVFSEYIRYQCDSYFKYNDLMIPLEDELTDIMVTAMFRESMIQKVFEVLHVRHKNAGNGVSMTEVQQEIYRAAKDFLKMVVHMDEHEYAEAAAIMEQYSDIYPEHLWILRCRTELACAEAAESGSKDKWMKAADTAKAGLSVHPDDDILNKRYADAILQLGETDQAEAIYHSVARSSINGLILREMKEYGIEEAALKLDAKVWSFD